MSTLIKTETVVTRQFPQDLAPISESHFDLEQNKDIGNARIDTNSISYYLNKYFIPKQSSTNRIQAR